MAPKKRARPTLHTASSGLGEESTTQASPITSDGWTDEQETTLFKAISIYRLKPVGMHKHFRIMAIAELMKNHGVSSEHTSINGIWAKLKTLYNLETLDELEDDFGTAEDDDADADDDSEKEKKWMEFALPEDDFAELMSNRRFDPDSNDSPPRSVKAPSTVPDSDGDTVSGEFFFLFFLVPPKLRARSPC